MLKIHTLTFNPFSENTYIVADETGACAIIDPGCSDDKERRILDETIKANGLNPVLLLNTHCHIDHFPGNKHVCDTYGLLPQFHELEYTVMLRALDYRDFFGFQCEPSPKPDHYLEEGDIINLGSYRFHVLFTPGHSPGSLSFYEKENRLLFGGDVLFYGSVGRYDIPGADGKVLYKTLTEKIMNLPDDVRVYAGHGPSTTIGHERKTNPFLNKSFF